MTGYMCSTWILIMNCYPSNALISPLGGKFKIWKFFKQHWFLPDSLIFVIKYYFIPTLPIKGKLLLRRLVLLPSGYCCACYQAKRWLQQMIVALCPNDFPSKGKKAKQSTGVETFTFTMNLQCSSQKVRHFEMIYLTFIVLVSIYLNTC